MLFLGLFIWVSTAVAQTPDQIKTLAVGSEYFTYLSNQSVAVKNDQITHAFIVIHGSELNSFNYFRSIIVVSEKLGKAKETLVIAPSFKTRRTLPPSPRELSWTDEGWLRGDGADQNSKLSSFDIMDQLVSSVANPKRFPNLKSITITGHSAGGQLTQRYALGTVIDTQFPQINFRYSVLNPGSYVYLNKKRPDPMHGSLFSIPNAHSCSGYNSYKFGLDRLNAYLSHQPMQILLPRYLQKDITYFLGEADNDPGHVDQSCEAALQGAHRLARGLYFKAFLDSEFPGHRHSLVTAPNVIHSQRAMYTSPEGVKVLFPRDTRSGKPAGLSAAIQ